MQSKYRLKMTELGYSLPIFNKINSLSQSLSPDENSWFKGERKCCGDFAYYYLKSDNLYKKSADYLKKSRESDRSPIPIYVITMIVIILGLEAWGFSYIFAGYVIPGASAQVQQYGGLGIALFTAVILSVLTHEVGREWYINFKLREYSIIKGHKEFKNENREVTIDDTFSDDKHQEFEKLGNRIGVAHKQSYIKSIVTSIFILIIAIGAWYVRQEALNTEIRDLVNYGEVHLSSVDIENMKNAGWATFGILSVIFVFLQLIGALFGNKWGFIGKESQKAYFIAHKFNTAQDFEQQKTLWNKEISELAEKYLILMQHKISKRIENDIRGATPDQGKAIELMPVKNFNQYMINIERGENAFKVKKSPKNQEENKDFNNLFVGKNEGKKQIEKSEIGFKSAAKIKNTAKESSQNENDFFAGIE